MVNRFLADAEFYLMKHERHFGGIHNVHFNIQKFLTFRDVPDSGSPVLKFNPLPKFKVLTLLHYLHLPKHNISLRLDSSQAKESNDDIDKSQNGHYPLGMSHPWPRFLLGCLLFGIGCLCFYVSASMYFKGFRRLYWIGLILFGFPIGLVGLALILANNIT
jgi:hypothetical protein